MLPNRLVLTANGTVLETISRPTPDNTIMVREPGNPTTMVEVEMSGLRPAQVCCERDGTVWIPFLDSCDGRPDCWIDCPTCRRGYFYERDKKEFFSDRKLTVLPV